MVKSSSQVSGVKSLRKAGSSLRSPRKRGSRCLRMTNQEKGGEDAALKRCATQRQESGVRVGSQTAFS